MAELDLSIDVSARLGINPAALSLSALTQMTDILDEINRDWGTTLRQVWPVDTGRSLSNWQNFVSGLVWVLVNPVEYASFVHPAGMPEGESGAFMAGEASRLLTGVMPRLLAISQADAQQRQLNLLTQQQPSGLSLFRGIVSAFRAVSSRERNRSRARLR